jgi:SAM-dependent methyltransferase
MSQRGWQVEDVTNVEGAEYAARNYIEQHDLRRYLQTLRGSSPRATACDVGAGFGRLTVVLQEFFEIVVAFEREPQLVERGAYLHPTIRFERVDELTRLSAPNGAFDFALSFTVLQHMTGEEVVAALAEMSRVVKPRGSILLCEHTGEGFGSERTAPVGSFTVGRPVEEYARLLPHCALVEYSPRRVQRGGKPADEGRYMLFRRLADAA